MAIVIATTFELSSLGAWAALGLLAGWLAGRYAGGAYGSIADLVFGLIGALAGGYLHTVLKEDTGGTAFWPSLPVAILGACVLLGAGRLLSIGRRT